MRTMGKSLPRAALERVEARAVRSSRWRRGLPVGLALVWATIPLSCKVEPRQQAAPPEPKPVASDVAPGLCYTNLRFPRVPWSIHVVRVERAGRDFEITTTQAREGAGEVSTLSEQIRALKPERGDPLAAINGDYYARGSVSAGDVRGLQILEGEMTSSPIGGPAFWVDSAGGFEATNVSARFMVIWPTGAAWPFGLNRARRGGVALYTPAFGPSTHTQGGRELVLEQASDGPWLPLKIGETFLARVREVRETGNTPLQGPVMVLSLDPALLRSVPPVGRGSLLRLSTTTSPHLRGVKTALSGGPVLVRDGRLLPIILPRAPEFLPYTLRSMKERHPRSAIGWNNRYFFLIQVDGRQPGLSVGMTLEELGDFALKQLDCQQVMNLDGGASATLWVDGQVRNRPSMAGVENAIANALVVVRRKPSSAARGW
jgi:hypothetical protein